MGWNAENQSIFVGLNLGPTMEEAGYGNIKIIIMDDQRQFLPRQITLYHGMLYHT